MNRNPQIKLLSECSLDDAVAVWNKGFSGYFVDLTMSVDSFLARLHNEGISPELSIIAFEHEQPVGFLLSGMRMNGDMNTAWNGGTGVIPDFRGRGLGRTLVNAALDLYREKDVKLATLEALSSNDAAINLYECCGYEIVDRLVFLEHKEILALPNSNDNYHVLPATPFEVGQLDFYDATVAWQSQWQSLVRNDGEGLMVLDREDPVGYALFRKRLDDDGALLGTSLHQLGIRPNHEDTEAVAWAALREAFAPLTLRCRRLTYNLSRRNTLVCALLEAAGFHMFVEQVQMNRRIDET